MIYAVTYWETYKTVHKVMAYVDADSIEEAIENIREGEGYDEEFDHEDIEDHEITQITSISLCE